VADQELPEGCSDAEVDPVVECDCVVVGTDLVVGMALEASLHQSVEVLPETEVVVFHYGKTQETCHSDMDLAGHLDSVVVEVRSEMEVDRNLGSSAVEIVAVLGKVDCHTGPSVEESQVAVGTVEEIVDREHQAGHIAEDIHCSFRLPGDQQRVVVAGDMVEILPMDFISLSLQGDLLKTCSNLHIVVVAVVHKLDLDSLRGQVPPVWHFHCLHLQPPLLLSSPCALRVASSALQQTLAWASSMGWRWHFPILNYL
jgi:hypothetical protein